MGESFEELAWPKAEGVDWFMQEMPAKAVKSAASAVARFKETDRMRDSA